MLYVLFFLFRDGRTIGAQHPRRDAARPRTTAGALLDMFAAVVRATVKGNIVIAIIQGTIGGVAFWLLGIQGALLWGVLMTFLSLLPAVGSALVWVPAAAYLLLTGAVCEGRHPGRWSASGDRPRRQPAAPVAGRQGHPAARLRRPRLDGRRPVALRDQRLRHRPADRGAVHRGLDAVPRRAGGPPRRGTAPDRARRFASAARPVYGRQADRRRGAMAFFQKLKERLFKSSSKIEEGLDAILDEAPGRARAGRARRGRRGRSRAAGAGRAAVRAGEGPGARRRHARGPRGAADRRPTWGSRPRSRSPRASPRAASAAGSARARSASCWPREIARDPRAGRPADADLPQAPAGGAGGRRQRLGQDHDDRQAREPVPRRRQEGGDRRRRHLPRRGGRAAADLGRARRRAGDDRAAGLGPGEPRLRRDGPRRGRGRRPAARSTPPGGCRTART